MDSKRQSSPPNAAETKATFRRPSNDVGGRKYRRHSPDNQSPEHPDNPKSYHRASPIFSRGEPAKVSDRREQWKDQERKYDSDQLVKGGDSYKQVDGRPPKNPHPYSKHDDYGRVEKYADEDRRNQKRESSGAAHPDRARIDRDNGRARDSSRNAEKYSRDRDTSRSKEKESYSDDRHKYKDKHMSPDRHVSKKPTNSNYEDLDSDRHRGGSKRDEGRDYRRNSDYKSERTDYCEEARGFVRESSSFRRDNEKYHRSRESHKSNPREIERQREKKDDDYETDRDKHTSSRAAGHAEKSEPQQSEAKRPKLFGSDHDVDQSRDGEKQSSSPKHVTSAGNIAVGNSSEVTNDLNAAKVAAMKAAELGKSYPSFFSLVLLISYPVKNPHISVGTSFTVNKNLVGGSFMSTEQKKKLLWGSKKSTTAAAVEPSGHRWDTTVFGDRERQEKFNKLMSLSPQRYLWPIVGCEGGREGGNEDQQSRRRRQSSVSRKAGAATSGVREAVHSGSSKERWTYSWIGALIQNQITPCWDVDILLCNNSCNSKIVVFVSPHFGPVPVSTAALTKHLCHILWMTG
ncbi:hypothetical protein LINGRAHAP2_LOCUS16521 [Linum grandiflorum]